MVTVHLVKGAFKRRRLLYGFWGFSLAAAVTGLMVIDVYRASLSGLLKTQGAKMLSAHVSISARREIRPDEHEKFKNAFPPGTSFSHVTEMFAMVSSAKESRLAALRFIDERYPLIGELRTDEGSVNGADTESAFASPDLVPLMNLARGEKLKVGQREFQVSGFIAKDSSQAFRGNSMAPRIYLSRAALPATKLMQFGSTFKDSWYASLPNPPPANLKKDLEKLFPDPALDITVPSDLEQGSLRVLSRTLDYLGLVGLITLALGWIGVYYLGRRWLYLSRPSIGLLKCLGFNPREVTRVLFLELLLILTFGAALGGLFSWGLAHLAGPALERALPEDFHLLWSWRSSLLLLLVGPGVGVILLFESVWRTAEAPALDLVADRPAPRRGWLAWVALGTSLLVMSLALTFLQARSWVVTLAFLAELAGSLALVAGLAYVALLVVKRLRRSQSKWLWHTVASQWIRRPGLSILLVSVTALSGLLTQLIPHLEKTLVGELKGGPAADRPSVFMFDVQDDQVSPLSDLLEKNGLQVSEKAPMIRARLLRVNGQEFERFEVGDFSTREQEGDARMRNRGVNLSYRETLSRFEKTLEGPEFINLRTSPAELSVESAYAERLGVKMGDQLLFDVQGVEVPAVVAHIRQVDWDSFEPNFFMQFRPGVLDEAPKTWVVTVKRNPKIKPPEVQRLVAMAFPNVTSINIAEAIDTISGLMAKLGFGLRIASRLSLALGFFVFLMIIVFQLMSSEKDWLELHRLGLNGRELQKLQIAAFGGLALTGTVLGTGLSLVVNWTLARFTFGVRAQFDYFNSTEVLLFSVFAATLALVVLSRRQFHQTQFKSRLDPL